VIGRAMSLTRPAAGGGGDLVLGDSAT
jgi:hypothetical protein